MPTIQERYDIERNRVVKNISLLKALKAQMNEASLVEAEKAQILLELQRSETTEDWDEYERLTKKLKQIELVNEVEVVNAVMIEGVAVTACTNDYPQTQGIAAHVPIVVQEVNPVNRVVTERNVLTADTDDVTDVASDDDDDDPFDRGCTFPSATDLLHRLSDYAKARNFTVRREKHAIVCSNAGESNWTAVKDYESRANQTFRKLQKQLDQDVNDNLEDIMQNEEDKVFAVHAFLYLIFTVLIFSHLLN
jgi:hypothetical protein